VATRSPGARRAKRPASLARVVVAGRNAELSDWKVSRIKVTVGGYTPAAKPSTPQARNPAADRSTLQAIQAAVQAQDFPRAAAMAEHALRGGLEHPMVLNLAALKYEQENRFEEALKVLNRAVELAPQDIGSRNALGLVLTRMERYREALAVFEGVCAMAPDFAGAHCARGASLEALARLKEAEAAYGRALELDPDNLGAMQGMANLLGRRGAHADARPLAEAVLEAEPNFPDAVMVLAAADVAEGAGERAQRRLELLTGDERLTAHQRALAQGLLGDVLDAQNLPVEAFQAYTACNMALWRAYAPLHGQGTSALEFARGMIGELDAIAPERWTSVPGPGAADAPRTHVFLLGFPGSGAAALERALASHPDVEAVGGRETLEAAQRAYLAQPQDLIRLAEASEAELAPLREAYWARVREEGAEPAGKVFVDNQPLNTVRLPLILKLFPEAKILFARRDPRDVALASFRRRFAMSPATYQLLTLPGAAGFYDAAMRLADRLEPAFASRLHVVRHEAVEEDRQGEFRQLCEALGLPWTEHLGVFAAGEGVGSWRRYKDQMAPVLPILAPWVQAYGYPPE
jgi:tetratricopeptide (TPR) repeat protein